MSKADRGTPDDLGDLGKGWEAFCKAHVGAPPLDLDKALKDFMDKYSTAHSELSKPKQRQQFDREVRAFNNKYYKNGSSVFDAERLKEAFYAERDKAIGQSDDILSAVDNKTGFISEQDKKTLIDPIAYAAEHGYQIYPANAAAYDLDAKGQDPLAWAAKNNKTINAYERVQTEETLADGTTKRIVESVEVRSKTDPVAWAANQHPPKKIEGQDPLAWAAKEGVKIKEYGPDGQVTEMDAIDWAAKNKPGIAQPELAAAVLTAAVDDFTKEVTKAKLDNKQLPDVGTFYNKVLETLEKTQCLKADEVNAIKESDEYKEAIAGTTTLLKTTTPNLSVSDKVCHGVGKLCAKVGLTSLAKVFEDKVVNKQIEVIEKSMDIGKALSNALKDKGESAKQAVAAIAPKSKPSQGQGR